MSQVRAARSAAMRDIFSTSGRLPSFAGTWSRSSPSFSRASRRPTPTERRWAAASWTIATHPGLTQILMPDRSSGSEERHSWAHAGSEWTSRRRQLSAMSSPVGAQPNCPWAAKCTPKAASNARLNSSLGSRRAACPDRDASRQPLRASPTRLSERALRASVHLGRAPILLEARGAGSLGRHRRRATSAGRAASVKRAQSGLSA